MNKLAFAVASFVVAGFGGAAQAQEFYLGQVFMTAATYCPPGSLQTKGQVLLIQDHMALFSLLRLNYGGDGQTTFALPNASPPAGSPFAGPTADIGLRYCIVVEGVYPPRP